MLSEYLIVRNCQASIRYTTLGRQFAEHAESPVAERLHRDPKSERTEERVQTLEFRVSLYRERSVERRGVQVRLLGYLRNAAKRLGHAPEREQEFRLVAVFEDRV